MTKTPALSLATIEAQAKSDAPVPFEPFDKDGNPCGITLMILSDQSDKVRLGINVLENQRRRRAQLNAEKASKARPGEVFTPVEDDIDFGLKMTALRIAGWQGLDEPYSEENALRLLRAIPSFIAQITAKGAELAGFTNTSAKIS
jgi:hypothetical protein